ncbi:MAG: SDR family NAD(P)-dependent oxidoreductase [Hyphomicrobiaceae bacterium]|nr:SDR family NAD(P)-dependent oxidoreductase [Hyphomicrobiaceae bacterium]
MARQGSAWFRSSGPRRQVHLRLICLPPGGGGVHVFRSWSDRLPDWIEVVAVEPPGRGRRMREAAIADMVTMRRALAAAIAAETDRPYALFGHSVGALIAFETALELTRIGAEPPLQLFLAGYPPPAIAAAAAPMHGLPDRALMAALDGFGALAAFGPQWAKSDDVARLILDPVRADFRLAETHRVAADARLAVPITVLGGASDPIVAAQDLSGWSAHAGAGLDVRILPGGHFFTQSAEGDLLAGMAGELADDLARLPPAIARGPTEPYPLDTCLHELFRQQAARTPEATALVGTDGSLTFEALDAESDLLARKLVSLGAGVDRLTAILMDTSVEFVVAYLAALKSGGAYMPIPLGTPDRQIAAILDATRPVAIATRSQLCARLPADWQDRAIALDRGWQAKLDTEPLPDLASVGTPGPENLAYCVTTSGTTGAPKAIVCPHRGAVNSYWWRYGHLPYAADEREAANVFFVWEVLRPLLAGKPAFVIPDAVIFDPRRLVAWLAEYGITRVLFTPSLYERVLASEGEGLAVRLPELNTVILNGEMVPRALVETSRRLLPHVRLINDYSISECHDVATMTAEDAGRPVFGRAMPTGRVMGNVAVYILDEALAPVPYGVPGEIYVGGASVARGYLDSPESTAERFLPDPFAGEPDARMFRTGDAGRLLPDGQLEVHGRIKFMVKIRGYSVVPAAVEAEIKSFAAISAALVVDVADEETGRPDHLVAYVAGHDRAPSPEELASLATHLRERLAASAIPQRFIPLPRLPIDPNTGKVDRRALPDPRQGPLTEPVAVVAAPDDPLVAALARAFAHVLGLVAVGADDHFFELGGHSLKAIELVAAVEAETGVRLDVIDVFDAPTPRLMAGVGSFRGRAAASLGLGQKKLEGLGGCASQRGAGLVPLRAAKSAAPLDVAVIGMALRLPGADTPEQLWENVLAGRSAIRHLSDADLRANGVPEALLSRPDYVKVGAILDDVGLFDHRHFGLSQAEATLMDPQHRLFITCCLEALERAGYGAHETNDRRVGVYAGCYLPSYLVHHLGAARHLDAGDPALFHLTEIGNDKDYLATRTAYLLDLTGPAISVQTSCSTGLVAIAQAAEAVASGQCDMALAGASSLTFPQGGFVAMEGHVGTGSGICRTFDARADGTILGDGVGVVVLKRLADALADGDQVIAVIKGAGLSNDGARKAGYSAPSASGQAEAITRAMERAGVLADSIGYVEAHGTGTKLGDPMEVRGLTTAFARCGGAAPGTTALGSIKPNIGHSNIAAGVAGFIKAALAVRHGIIPPLIHYETENPELKLAATPFYVPTRARSWPGERRAGVSSFGIGGTNCHVVIEAGPEPDAPCRPPPLPTTLRPVRCWPENDVARAAAVPASKRPLPFEQRFFWPTFVRLPPLPRPTADRAAGVVILGAERGAAEPVGLVLANFAEAGVETIRVDGWPSADLSSRLAACRGADGRLPRLVWLGSLGTPRLDELVGVLQVVAACGRGETTSLWVVTSGAIGVTEAPDDLSAAMLPAATLVASQEAPHLAVRLIDLLPGPQAANLLMREVLADTPRPQAVIAIRDGAVWTERFEPLALPAESADTGRALLTSSGPHIITGARGRIGQALATHIAALGAPSVLVSRTRPPLPDPSRAIAIAADVTDEDGLHRLLSDTVAEHGRLGVIFHAAGLADLTYLDLTTPETIAAEFAPKVAGTDALAAALVRVGHETGVRPAAVVLFSSLAGALGGYGMAAYGAANRYLDGMAESLDAQGCTRWLSIAWDDWDFTYGKEQTAAYARRDRALSIPVAEGIAALEALLGEHHFCRVAVSMTDLNQRYRDWCHLKTSFPSDVGPARVAVEAVNSGTAMARSDCEHADSPSVLDIVLQSYAEVLGSAGLAPDADFFDLGGDSLLAAQLAVNLNACLAGRGRVGIADILDQGTPRALARIVEGGGRS